MTSIKLARNSKQSWKASCNAQKRHNKNFRQRSPGLQMNETSGRFVFLAEFTRCQLLISPFCQNKFMSLQTMHNTTTTSLQRELDQLRQEYQKTKIYIRELEMGNDDLERNERAVSSSLADMESKYSKVLEEKILLEHELLEKAGLEEESQRLKDELRGISPIKPTKCCLIITTSRRQRRSLYTEGSVRCSSKFQVRVRMQWPFDRKPSQNGSSTRFGPRR